MDIYDYLEKDHAKVKELFKQYEKIEKPDHKFAFLELIIRELTLHAKSEEATFYKILEKFDDSKEAAQHGEKEHKDMVKAMLALGKNRKYQKSLDKQVEKLKELVEHHVKDEEGNIFRKAKSVLNREQEIALKEKMHYLKGKMFLAYKQI